MTASAPTYNFDAQFRQGTAGEQYLDGLFGEQFDIQPATREQQRQGIDRIFRNRRTGKTLTVEYKTDWTASKTGNAFVETLSADKDRKAGWALTSQADYLVYCVPGDGAAIYIIPMQRIRAKLFDWSLACEERKIKNEGYNTVGLLVPLCEFERIAEEVM